AQHRDPFRRCARRYAQATTISAVAHQRIMNMAHVDTDLVRAAGLQLDPYMGVGTETTDYSVMADCLLAAGHHCHLLAIGTMSGNGRIHLATGGHDTDHHAFVFPGHGA